MENKSLKQILTRIGLSLLGLILINASAFVIQEGRQAVITQFGRPVRTITDAGLQFKIPFIQEVRNIDLRILNWDGDPNQIPTKDKKYILVDTTARWKIIDPLKFIQTVQDERGARTRLDAILDGITRDVISNHNLVEAVRNSNNIMEQIEARKSAAQEKKDDAPFDIQEEISGEIELIKIGREQLSQQIVNLAKSELLPLGVELIDVQLRRIAYEEGVQQKVYERMVSERERIAEKIRSYGKGEKAKIEGKTERELQSIQSEAYRKVQQIKGAAEAEAIAIYAKSMSQDPQFYKFARSLEAYEKALPEKSQLLLSSKSKFWRVLKSGETQ